MYKAKKINEVWMVGIESKDGSFKRIAHIFPYLKEDQQLASKIAIWLNENQKTINTEV